MATSDKPQSIIRVGTPGKLMEVFSSSGKRYEITYAGSGDGDPEYVSLWKCSCPAGQHMRECKHMRAFLNSRLMDYGDSASENEGVPREVRF